jgi:hypothetical protein
MAEVVYVLCGITSIACAWLLFRGYRSNRSGFLFWACLCFLGLAVNNVLLFVDLILVPETDLFAWRTAPALAGMAVLLFGLVWNSR